LERDVAYLQDCAQIEGNPLPATAQVAEQQGKYLAKSLYLLLVWSSYQKQCDGWWASSQTVGLSASGPRR
jgi:hypothetical protein